MSLFFKYSLTQSKMWWGVGWLSDKRPDLRSKVCVFEPHWRHCIVSLSKTHYPLFSTGLIQEDPSQHDWKNIDSDVKNKTKQEKFAKFISPDERLF